MLDYLCFFIEALPVLKLYWFVDLVKGLVRFRAYTESFKPPIPRRRELLLPMSHLCRELLSNRHFSFYPIRNCPRLMNSAQIKCIMVFSVFAVIGFGPVSPGCLIGMYAVATRPRWLIELVRQLYTRNGAKLYALPPPPPNPRLTRKKCFLSLIGLFVVDILPVPVTPVVAFFILLLRPQWFYNLIEVIYWHSPE